MLRGGAEFTFSDTGRANTGRRPGVPGAPVGVPPLAGHLEVRDAGGKPRKGQPPTAKTLRPMSHGQNLAPYVSMTGAGVWDEEGVH